MSLNGNSRLELRIFGRVFEGWPVYKVVGSSTGHGIAVSLRISRNAALLFGKRFETQLTETIAPLLEVLVLIEAGASWRKQYDFSFVLFS